MEYPYQRALYNMMGLRVIIKLKEGAQIDGVVIDITEDHVVLEITTSGAKETVPLSFLRDGASVRLYKDLPINEVQF